MTFEPIELNNFKNRFDLSLIERKEPKREEVETYTHAVALTKKVQRKLMNC